MYFSEIGVVICEFDGLKCAIILYYQLRFSIIPSAEKSGRSLPCEAKLNGNTYEQGVLEYLILFEVYLKFKKNVNCETN